MKVGDKGLSSITDFKIKYMIECGLYSNPEELVENAVKNLLLTHPQYRVEVAIRAYENGEISLNKASHIAGLNLEEIKELLLNRGHKLRLGAKTKEEAKKEVSVIEEAKKR